MKRNLLSKTSNLGMSFCNMQNRVDVNQLSTDQSLHHGFLKSTPPKQDNPAFVPNPPQQKTANKLSNKQKQKGNNNMIFVVTHFAFLLIETQKNARQATEASTVSCAKRCASARCTAKNPPHPYHQTTNANLQLEGTPVIVLDLHQLLRFSPQKPVPSPSTALVPLPFYLNWISHRANLRAEKLSVEDSTLFEHTGPEVGTSCC